jgi:glycine oxidase
MQVTSHRLALAFLEGARRRGAVIRAWTRVTAVRPGAVETDTGRIAAGTVVLCAGAWSGHLRGGLGLEPVRGQILLYRGELGRMVVFPGGEYAVPRRGGLLLFGSTLEHAGFDARPTREAGEALAGRAADLLGLRDGDLLAHWAGLRPGTRSLLPCLGPDPGQPGLVHASGHYRNGILLAPLTARIVAELVLGRPTGHDLKPFLPPARQS